jgi:hypothetical protein
MKDNLVFENMNSLESLDLSSNRLNSIPLSIGFCYNSLLSLSMAKNPLNSDNAMLWRQISSLEPLNFPTSSQDSNRTSRSSFDDYLSARLQGKLILDKYLGSPPKGFVIARKMHDRGSNSHISHMRSYSSSTNSVSLSRRLLILKDIFDLYRAPDENSTIISGLETATKKNPSLAKRNKIIAEIISTEETYVNQLEILMNIYVRPLRALDILPREAYEFLFSNVEGIYLLHKMYVLISLMIGNSYQRWQTIVKTLVKSSWL